MKVGVDRIDGECGERTGESAQRRQELYFSMKELGLLEPIGVSPSAPGRYVVVFGRRRLACARKLDWAEVECTVLDLDELHREMAEITENLHRLDLEPHSKHKAMRRYAELFRLAHPELSDARARLESGTNGVAPVREDRPARQREQKKRRYEREVARTIADVAGTSLRTARRALQHGDAFTAEQEAVLDRANVTTKRRDALAAIEDDFDRAAVIDLLGQSMDFDAAVAEVLGEEAEELEQTLATVAKVAPEVSDDEWVEALPLWNMGVNRERFRADALFYRRIREARQEFARVIGWPAAAEGTGIYGRRLKLFLDAKHPKDWTQCHNCVRGMTAGGEHQACRGGGYYVD